MYIAAVVEKPKNIAIKYPIMLVNITWPIPVINDTLPTSLITLGFNDKPTRNNNNTIPFCANVENVSVALITLKA